MIKDRKQPVKVDMYTVGHVMIDEHRNVTGYLTYANENEYDGMMFVFKNKGVETEIVLSDEAIDAMIAIRSAVKNQYTV